MTENTGLDADLATLRRYALAAAFPVESRAEEVRSALDRVEAEIARLEREKQVLVREAVRFTRGGDPDYSPDYQDEYQRLWHEAAARAEAAEAELARLREERDDARVMTRIANTRASEEREELHAARVLSSAREEAAEAECARLQQALDSAIDGLRWQADYAGPDGRAEAFTSIERARALAGDGIAREALAGPDTPADSQPEETTP